MLKTKISITKWIKSNFNNAKEFEDFLEYDYLNKFIEDGRKLSPEYQNKYKELKAKWNVLHDTIKELPEIKITERFGNETHITMRTPLSYMSGFYRCDAKKRNGLFKKLV